MDAFEIMAEALAAAFLAGRLEVDELVDRGSQMFGKRRWLKPLAEKVAAKFKARPRPRRRVLASHILQHAGFRRACLRGLRRTNLLPVPAVMTPASAARQWDLPELCTPGQLAAWLGVTDGQLDWFADLRSMEYKQNQSRLRHYHYRILAKLQGKVRLIESPKPRLKQIQRRILSDILNQVPPHEAVHGFRPGRSIQSFASPHVGKRVVLRLDLEDFFPSIPLEQVRALFRMLGYPEKVADLLAGLCTNSAPSDVWDKAPALWRTGQPWETVRLYSQPHLPQGAPTSPALANLCAFKLDCRLAGLARSAGAEYTRYADDLAFSGGRDFERHVNRFHLHACATVMEEGFHVNHHKTRLMRQGVRQHLAGLVVNDRLNVPRADFDRLKAILTNCIRHGADSQNRNGVPDFFRHLDGRISFVESVHPDRGRRLRDLFNQIQWPPRSV